MIERSLYINKPSLRVEFQDYLKSGLIQKLQSRCIYHNIEEKKDDYEDNCIGKREVLSSELSYKEAFSNTELYERACSKLRKEEQEMAKLDQLYRVKSRVLIEKWKRALVNKYPISVSFRIHDINYVSDKVVQVIPKKDKLRPTILIANCFLIDPIEISRQNARNSMDKEGWTLQQLAIFAYFHVKHNVGFDFRMNILTLEFPRKTLEQFIETYNLIKGPLRIRAKKSYFKHLTDAQDQEDFKSVYIEDCVHTLVGYYRRWPGANLGLGDPRWATIAHTSLSGLMGKN